MAVKIFTGVHNGFPIVSGSFVTVKQVIDDILARGMMRPDPDKIIVEHWKYSVRPDDDYIDTTGVNGTGWSCWAYATHMKEDFEEWMEQNMLGRYDCTLRFNSGNPMYTVWIENEVDASAFKLRWQSADNWFDSRNP